MNSVQLHRNFQWTVFAFSRLKGEAWVLCQQMKMIVYDFCVFWSVLGNVWHGLPRRRMDCDTEKGWWGRWFPKAVVWLSGWIWRPFRSNVISPLFFFVLAWHLRTVSLLVTSLTKTANPLSLKLRSLHCYYLEWVGLKLGSGNPYL